MRCALDDLIFSAAPMGESSVELASHSTVLSWPMATGNVATGKKHFQQAVPLWSRRPPMNPTDASWPAYCGLLKDFGIPLQSNVAALESLSVTNVPVRFAKRSIDEPYVAMEIETAEAVEINCVKKTGKLSVAHFPHEIQDWPELKVAIECLREIASSHTPIGIGIPAGDVAADILNALAAKADYVVLEFPETTTGTDLDFILWGVSTARAACTRIANFPIYVDAPILELDHFVKLLAVGASAVTIDALARQCLPAPTTAPSSIPRGMLSGLGTFPSAPAPSVSPLETKLQEIISCLSGQLARLQLSELRQLNKSHLRALTETAARLCGIEPLAVSV